MAKAKFDIRTKDNKSEAQRGLHAGVGAADLALEAVKEYVAEAQKRVVDAQKRLDAVQKDVQKDAQEALTSARRSARDLDVPNIDPALAGDHGRQHPGRGALQGGQGPAQRDREARRGAPGGGAEVRRALNVETATGTYADLAKRGQQIVNRLRKETAAVADPGPVQKSTGVTLTISFYAKKTPAKKAPVKKTAKKAPAKKTAAK